MTRRRGNHRGLTLASKGAVLAFNWVPMARGGVGWAGALVWSTFLYGAAMLVLGALDSWGEP